MEVWKRGTDGQYALLKTFPICRWSGQLGPKVREGDRQAPEGSIPSDGPDEPELVLLPVLRYRLPNAFDRANGRTGSYLMVHGTCSSAGCFAMTDEAIAEIYAIAREAFAGGQRAFQFQSYPFRMTAQNLAKFRNDPNIAFWKQPEGGLGLLRDPARGAAGRRLRHALRLRRLGRGGGRLQSEGRSPRRRQSTEGRGRGGRARRQGHGGDAPRLPGWRPAPVLPRDRAEHPALRRAGAAAAEHGHISRPEALAAAPEEITIEPKVKPVLLAKIDPKHDKGKHGAVKRPRSPSRPRRQPGPDPDPRGRAGRRPGGADHRGERRRRPRGLSQAPRQPVRRRPGGAPGRARRPAGGRHDDARGDLAGRAPAEEGHRPVPPGTPHGRGLREGRGLNPATAKKAEAKPAEGKSAETKPAETKPAAKPAEKAPETGKRTEAPNRNRVAASQPAN